MNFRSNHHSWAKRRATSFSLNPRLRQTNIGDIGRFGSALFLDIAQCLLRIVLPLIRNNRILAQTCDDSFDKAVAREIESSDLHLRVLTDMDKTDIAIADMRFDLQPAILWYNEHQRLGRRDHATDRVNRELLYGPTDRGP